jgi:hypothetical protein
MIPVERDREFRFERDRGFRGMVTGVNAGLALFGVFTPVGHDRSICFSSLCVLQAVNLPCSVVIGGRQRALNADGSRL